jgi:2-haloacid dehalogenase
MNMDTIQALTFDVGGTVFDWQTAVRKKVGSLDSHRNSDIDVPQFALDWRLRFFQLLAQVRKGERDWCSADVLQLAALVELSEEYPALQLTRTDRAELVEVWHAMNVWPDFPDALARLRTRYRVVVLTVMSFSVVLDSSRHAGITWDGILSGEFMNQYKPEREAYLEAAERIRIAPENVMMVAAHPGDLRASMNAGFRTAYVQSKLDEPFGTDDQGADDFDIVAADFTDLADQLVD